MRIEDIDPRVRELARSFDDAFAEPEPAPPARMDGYLLVAVGPDRLALPMAALGGLLAARTIVPLPSDAPALLGLIGHRGTAVAVWSLGLLVGRQPPGPSPWIVLSAGDAPVGLAVDRLERHLERPPDARIDLEGPIEGSRYIKQSIRSDEGPIEVVEVGSLVAALRTR